MLVHDDGLVAMGITGETCREAISRHKLFHALISRILEDSLNLVWVSTGDQARPGLSV